MTGCPRCNGAVDPDWDVCPTCGQSLTDVEPPDANSTQLGQYLFIAGAVALGVGITLPWFEISIGALGFSETIRGFDTVGLFLGVGVALAVLLSLWRWGPLSRGVAGIIGLAAAGTTAAAVYSPIWLIALEDRGVDPAAIESLQAFTDVKIGIYVTGVAGLLLMIGASYDTAGVDGIDTSGPPERYRVSDFDDGRQRAIAEAIDDHGVADQDAIVREVYVEHSDGHSDRDAWWADVEGELREDDRLNDTGRGWTLAKK